MTFSLFVVPAERPAAKAENWQRMEGTTLCVDKDSESLAIDNGNVLMSWVFKGCSGNDPQVRIKIDCGSFAGQLSRNISVPAFAKTENGWVAINVAPNIETYGMIKEVCRNDGGIAI